MMGIGIQEGVDDMLGLEEAYNLGKGIYGMKP